MSEWFSQAKAVDTAVYAAIAGAHYPADVLVGAFIGVSSAELASLNVPRDRR